MTDAEIKKALECHCHPVCCIDCPMHNREHDNCVTELWLLSFDLINRQQAEIERLENKVEELSEVLSNSIRIRYAEAKAEAIKEFTSIIESNDYTGGGFHLEVSRDFWDKTKKEMVGESK